MAEGIDFAVTGDTLSRIAELVCTVTVMKQQVAVAARDHYNATDELCRDMTQVNQVARSAATPLE